MPSGLGATATVGSVVAPAAGAAVVGVGAGAAVVGAAAGAAAVGAAAVVLLSAAVVGGMSLNWAWPRKTSSTALVVGAFRFGITTLSVPRSAPVPSTR